MTPDEARRRREEIRALRAAGVPTPEIARQFGVTRGRVSQIAPNIHTLGSALLARCGFNPADWPADKLRSLVLEAGSYRAAAKSLNIPTKQLMQLIKEDKALKRDRRLYRLGSSARGPSKKVLERAREAYRLRSHGMTYQQIGDALGIKVSSARRAVLIAGDDPLDRKHDVARTLSPEQEIVCIKLRHAGVPFKEILERYNIGPNVLTSVFRRHLWPPEIPRATLEQLGIE